jgi:hypothetical protein
MAGRNTSHLSGSDERGQPADPADHQRGILPPALSGRVLTSSANFAGARDARIQHRRFHFPISDRTSMLAK